MTSSNFVGLEPVENNGMNRSWRGVMGALPSTFSGGDEQQLHHDRNGATGQGRRLLRRPTLAETERIARDCPAEGLSVTVVVQADAP